LQLPIVPQLLTFKVGLPICGWDSFLSGVKRHKRRKIMGGNQNKGMNNEL